MKSKLTHGLSKEDAGEIKAEYLSSQRYRKRMVYILNEEIQSLQKDMEREKWYETPNWSLVQADRVAQIKALKKIIELF